MARNLHEIPEQYWDIGEILRYQRNFMLINSERSIGKTYTTQKWVLQQCLKRKRQFCYIVRTKKEREKGVFQEAFEKVQTNEFAGHDFKWTDDTCIIDGEIVGICFCLSESQEIKKRSFPQIDYLIFDEYMIEKQSNARYVKGFKEPDILLNIYHTIDRDEDRVKCFLLGNNTSFYNPYHLHPAFKVEPIKRGEIWKSANVLYQWAEASEYVKAKKTKSKFGRMIAGTEYGIFSNVGEYIEDEESFIEKHTSTANYYCTIKVNGMDFGLYADQQKGRMYVSEKVDPSCPLTYALTLEDQSENVLVTRVKSAHMDRFAKAVRMGILRYESMLIKKACETAIQKLL